MFEFDNIRGIETKNNQETILDILFSVLIIIFLSGCTYVTDHEYVSTAAWSDDNQSIVYIHQKYEEKYVVPFYKDITNEKYALALTDREGEAAVAISRYFSGYGTEIYYKESARYFVVRNQELRHTVQKLNSKIIDYYILDLEGNVIYEIKANDDLECPHFVSILPAVRVIPSPNGKILAVVSVTPECKIQVELLDTEINFVELQSYVVEGSNIGSVFWFSEEYFFVNACSSFHCLENWYLMKLGDEALHVSNDLFNSLCLEGVLLGSDINTLGEKIVWTDPEKDFQILAEQHYTGADLGVLGQVLRELDNPEGCTSVSNL